jgi:glycyl-tRNA synthetase beta chain
MGMYFARAGGEPEAVASAIREHYLPRFAGDALPASVPGAVLAVADRLDSITACFAAGAIPTGSKDPLALRRAAIGILRLCAETPLLSRLSLADLLGHVPGLAPAVRAQVESFFADRYRGILADEHGVPTDVANAVTERLFSDASPAELVARAKALADHVTGTTGFGDFLDNVYKRVGNLLRKADEELPGWRDAARAAAYLDDSTDHGPTLALPQELEVEGLRVAARAALLSARASHDAVAVLDGMFRFGDPLARFFGTGRDGVPVLIEADEGLRLRRLALLLRVQSLFDWFAEFGRISTR